MRCVVAIACVLALWTSAVRAEPSHQEAKTAARQVLIALRVLAYDKALAIRKPNDVVTIIVVSTGRETSRSERAHWTAGFSLLPKVKVAGRHVRMISVDFTSPAALDVLLREQAPAMLIVGSDLGADTTAISKLTRARKVLSVTRGEDLVRAGLAVGLVSGRERDEIVINLDASRAEGARFGAGLLQLARLVEEEVP